MMGVEETAVDLYLDLLKRSLTNTIMNPEPDHDQINQQRFAYEMYEHYIKGGAVSMLPVRRLDNIQFCISELLRLNVPGDFIEAGVWRGGATIFMRGALKAFGVQDRYVWVADSFEGLPVPDAERFPREAKAHLGPVLRDKFENLAASLDEVRKNFQAYGLLDTQVRFLKGWFKDTLPNAPVEKLALMRLDGDFYESTMDSLTNLYDKLSVGGYVIIDDYGEEWWTYCRKAVDEFRSSRCITDEMIEIDSKCCYWQRTA